MLDCWLKIIKQSSRKPTSSNATVTKRWLSHQEQQQQQLEPQSNRNGNSKRIQLIRGGHIKWLKDDDEAQQRVKCLGIKAKLAAVDYSHEPPLRLTATEWLRGWLWLVLANRAKIIISFIIFSSNALGMVDFSILKQTWQYKTHKSRNLLTLGDFIFEKKNSVHTQVGPSKV